MNVNRINCIFNGTIHYYFPHDCTCPTMTNRRKMQDYTSYGSFQIINRFQMGFLTFATLTPKNLTILRDVTVWRFYFSNVCVEDLDSNTTFMVLKTSKTVIDSLLNVTGLLVAAHIIVTKCPLFCSWLMFR